MYMKLIVDRFEGEYVVCEQEDRTMVSIHRTQLPRILNEGSCLLFDGEQYTVDEKEEEVRRKRIQGKMESLWE